MRGVLATTHQVPVRGVQDPPVTPINKLRSSPSNPAMSLTVRSPKGYSVPQHWAVPLVHGLGVDEGPVLLATV